MHHMSVCNTVLLEGQSSFFNAFIASVFLSTKFWCQINRNQEKKSISSIGRAEPHLTTFVCRQGRGNVHRIVTSRCRTAKKKQGDEDQACHKEVHAVFVQLQKRFCKLKGFLGEEEQLAGVESCPESLEKPKQSEGKSLLCVADIKCNF